MNTRWIRIKFALGLASYAGFGCSTTATITRTSGPPVEAAIEGGSRSSIQLEGGALVPRSEIVDVDHPGNVHAVVGGVVLGYGLLNIAAGASQCGDSREFASKGEQNAFCVGMVTPALVGLGMTIWGLVVHSDSKSALKDTTRSLPEPAVFPTGPHAPYALPPARPAAPPPAGIAPSPAPHPGPSSSSLAPAPSSPAPSATPEPSAPGPSVPAPSSDPALAPNDGTPGVQ